MVQSDDLDEAGDWSAYARLKEPTFWHGSVSVHKFINPPNSPNFKCESTSVEEVGANAFG